MPKEKLWDIQIYTSAVFRMDLRKCLCLHASKPIYLHTHTVARQYCNITEAKLVLKRQQRQELGRADSKKAHQIVIARKVFPLLWLLFVRGVGNRASIKQNTLFYIHIYKIFFFGKMFRTKWIAFKYGDVNDTHMLNDTHAHTYVYKQCRRLEQRALYWWSL